MAGAAPWQRERRRVLAGDVDLKGLRQRPFLVLLLLEVVPFRLQNREDRLGRSGGRKAAPERQNVQRVEAGRLEAELCGDFTGGVHLRDTGRKQQTFGGELVAPFYLRLEYPVLLAGRILIMTPCRQSRFDRFGAVFDEGADHV